MEKVIGAAIILAISILALYLGLRDYRYYTQKLKTYNAKTTGTLLDVTRRTPNLAMETFGTIEFFVANKSYRQTEELSVGINFRPFLKAGNKVVVHFDPNNPQNSTAINKKDFFPIYVFFGLLSIVMLHEIVKGFFESP